MNAKKILAMLVLTLMLVALFTSCESLGDIFGPKDEHEHEYAGWTIQTPPTEQDTGIAIGKCECEDSRKFVIPALTDSSVWTKTETPATHVDKGLTVYTSVYGSVEIESDVIPHEWTYTLTTEPTEAAEGAAERSCACGATETVVVPALSDATVWSSEVTKAPTHLEEGEKTYTSALYGSVKVAIAKTADHSFGAWVVITQATETAEGSAERECACGDKETGVIPVLTDATVWTAEVTVAPTHLTLGEKTYTSALYGTVKVTLAKTTEHSHGAWVVITQATETAEGSAERECACGDKETGVIPVLTDATVWTAEITKAPSHLEEGEKTYTSALYGTVKVTLAKTTEHSHGAWVVITQATETAEGSAERECACGDKETGVIPVLTDATVWTAEITKAPSHLEEGEKTYTSALYGTVKVSLPKNSDHGYGAWVVITQATETVEGSAERECACGEKETGGIPVLTDATVWAAEVTVAPTHLTLGEKTYTSALYGSVKVTLAKTPDHSYGAWTVITAPTETAEGSAERECACGDKETGAVPKLTDTTVWTAEVTTLATYNAKGEMTYTSLLYGTYTAEIAKLVAPYDGKTYANLVFDGELEDSNKVTVAQDTWSGATLTLDENGFGFCTSYPYRGFTQITMVDPETGRINVTIYDIISTDADGNALADPVPNYESYTTYAAYVDFATGIIVRARNSAFDYVVLYTPFEAEPSSDAAQASSWNGNAMAITYTVNGTSYNVYCTSERAYIGVSFTDMAGNAVSADACYNAPCVYIKDANGALIASYGYDGEKQNALDGFEGSYTGDMGELVVSGFGTLTLGGTAGSYVQAADGDSHDLNVYLKDADGNVTHFYTVTLGEGTYTASMPKVTVSFVTGGYAEQAPIEYNKNVPQTLPTYTHETMTFKGWFYDADCTQPVEAAFVPTSDVTLYAQWKSKVVIYLIGVADGDASVLYLGEGDVIGDFLPAYGLDVENSRRFDAWYVDANANGELDEEDFALDLETTITADDTDATIIAKWNALPAYYGTYWGVEIWNAGYGNSSKTPLTIDENGNMSGLKTGIIVSYDPETQVVQWKKSATDTTTYTFYFDAETGIIAGIYNNYDIGNDYYLYSRYTEATNGVVTACYGVKAPKTPGSTDYGYYAQFITVATKLGENTTIFLYNNHIYNDVTIATTTGELLTPATVKDAKTVVVKDNKTGATIVAVTSVGSSFANNNNTAALDAYYGSYAMGDETVILDGTGTIVYAGKTGTYTETANGFDVYFAVDGVNTEYYVLTLDTAAKTCTLTKPMANVVLDAAGKEVELEQIGSVNINIAVALPTLTHSDFVFRGWYVQGDETMTPVADAYVPTGDVTLVAIWKVRYTVNVVYNDTVTESIELVYGEGEIATVDNPTYAKHKFDGWFTTAEFSEGTEWTSGSAVTSSITIYAKWSEAPIYNLNYTVTELERNNDSNLTDLIKAYTRTAANFTIDPDGKSPKTSYPFATGEISITDYDPETGSLVFNCGTKAYKGFIDKETGIILVNYKDGDVDMEEFFLLNPFDTKSIATKIFASYWNGGKTACIVYTLDEETSYTIFVNNNQVYFGVSFEDAEGNAVAGDACYQSSMLYVRDAEGDLIAYFAYNGETMCELDGFEGTYSGEQGDVVVSGYGTLEVAGLKGDYTANENGTFSAYLYNEDGSVYMFYIVTLDKAERTYTAAPVPVVLTFVTDHGSAAAMDAFANVPSVLPTLTETGFVFRGWYVQGDDSQTIVDASAFVSDKSVTLVAKWDPMLSVTIVYGNGIDTVIDYYGAGDTPVLTDPAYTNGKAFSGWFTDADCTVAYTAAPISESITVYAKWIDAHPMFGSYAGANVYGSTAVGNTNSGGSSLVTIVIDALGNVTGKTKGQIREYDPETGVFKLYTEDSKYSLGIFDAATGVMIFNYSANSATTMGNDVYVYAPGTTFKCSSTDGCYWNGGKTKLGAIQCDAGVVNYFMFNDRIYTGVTWTSDDGEVAANQTYLASNLSVYDREGNLIAYFAKESGKGLIQKINDGIGGTYYTEGENDPLVLNGYGAGTITNAAMGLDSASFTYTVDGNNLQLVIGDAYYNVVIGEGTYTIQHIKYTISFVTGIDGFTIDSVEVEYNADYRLPSGIDQPGFKFEGWYTSADFTGGQVYWYEDNSDMTYYAKWSMVCTVTLVYGDGIENVNLSYSSGETVTMGASLSPDATGLYAWYTDEAHTTPFTSTTISGNVTLYGVRVAEVTYGSYKFVDKNGSLVSNNKGVGSSTASMTVTFLTGCEVSYNYDVSSESGWDKFTAKETVSGATTTTVSGASGEDSGTKTVTLAAGDSLKFEYTKDSSGNRGDDTVTITLTITPIA